MIAVDQATTALARPDALSDGDYFLHISFLETEDAKAAGQGASDFTRWKQTPAINATAKSATLPDSAVVLGSCTVKAGQFVGTGTTTGRQYSGLRLPGPNQGAAATLRNPGAADDLVVLGGALTIRRDARGGLGPTLTLLDGSTGGTGAGGAIDFNGYDPGTNDPSLRIRSLDDGSSSSHLTFSTKQPGPQTNKLTERLRLTSDGLLQFPTDAKDKIVLSDNGTDRYGIGLSSSNISLFCPTTASFSVRQNSSTGTEVFKVAGSGQVTFSGPIDTSLTIRRDVKDALGPTLKLLNGSAPSTVGGAGGAIDFNGYDPATSDPSLRIQSLDDGKSSSHLAFSTKQSGAAANKLVERLRLTSDGLLKFPNDSPKDKLVIYDNGATNRFGIGLNASNINLFCSAAGSFSLRQNSSSGTEVFSVSGSGTAKFSGAITPKVGNDSSSGIYFPIDPGGGSGDEAFLRYFVTSGEATKLMLGINNDPDDALVLYQGGAERLTIANSKVNIANNVIVSADVTASSLRLSDSSGTSKIRMSFADKPLGLPIQGLGIELPWGSAGLYSSGWSIASDAALKTDVVAYEPVLDRVMKLRPVRFTWKADGSHGSGFIAQEVEGLFPDLVHEGLVTAATGRPMKSVVYDRFGMLAIAAIKELKTTYDARLAALEQKLAAQGGKS